MALDIQRHKKRLYPTTLFEIIPKKIVEELIRGFFYKLKQAVTLRYVQYDPDHEQGLIQDDMINPFDFHNEEDQKFFNPVCIQYHKDTQNGDIKCKEFDKSIAEQCLKNKIEKLKPYACHLGLDDLIYPLYLGDRVYGILFAGQIIPNDNIRISLIKVKIMLDCEKEDTQIRNRILSALEGEKLIQWRNPDYENQRIESLREFGDTLQEIITQMYKHQQEAVYSDIIKETAQDLELADLTSPEIWWKRCQVLTESFGEFSSIKSIQVYSLEKGQYIRWVPLNTDNDTCILSAQDILPSIQSNKLIPLTDLPDSLAMKEKLDLFLHDPIYLFLHKNTTPDVSISTLMVLQGELHESQLPVIRDFCQILSQSADFASLIFHLRNTQYEFKRNVSEFCHDIRTPLQAALFTLENIMRLPEVKRNPALKKQVEDSILRTRDTKDYTHQLQSDPSKTYKEINLCRLLDQVIEDLMPIADRHPCKVTRKSGWDRTIWLYGDSLELRRCFMNLLENAIKYSFAGRYYDGLYQEQEVFIKTEKIKNQLTIVQISNYGIGIPQEKLNEIFMYGGRAKIPDEKIKRPGSGIGLLIAKKVLEKHNGFLQIDSKPADSFPRKKEEEYHRYITTVKTFLSFINRGE